MTPSEKILEKKPRVNFVAPHIDSVQEVFRGAIVLDEKDESGSDYVYFTGRLIDGKWKRIYVILKEEIKERIQSRCTNGRIGSIGYSNEWDCGSRLLLANDEEMIANPWIALIPKENIDTFVNNLFNGKGYTNA